MAEDSNKAATKLAHLGRDPSRFAGAVNPPPFRMSTVLAPDFATYTRPGRKFEPNETVYGRYGTPGHHALENLLTELEQGTDTVLLPSGLSAITTALFTVLDSGDEVLVSDSVYGPTRQFCDTVLSRMNITATYVSPTLDAATLRDRVGQATKAIFLESPGSMTFEIQDVPGLTQAAHQAGLAVLMDNTWATPLYFRPLEHGVDISIQAGTKYLVGHADAMIGSVTASEAWAKRLRETAYQLGNIAGSEETYLALRGARTLDVRLPRHWETGVMVAKWLETRPEVAEVRHPALHAHPQHTLWARDFDGASGLFAFVLHGHYSREALATMVDDLQLFGLGSSWGGFESLIVPGFPPPKRSASSLPSAGTIVRLHVGLEDPDDLIRDLGGALERLRATPADNA
mgnify:CR=1 FL=1